MTSMHTVELSATQLEDTYIFRFPSLSVIDGFSHAITSRPWNMATHCGRQTDRTIDRRRRVCDVLGLPFEGLTAPDQIHSAHVLRVLPSDIGTGRMGRHTAMRFIDGLVCDLPGVCLMQFSADCPLIVVVEPQRRIVGTAHASWRGTVAGIATELVRQLCRHFDSGPGSLIAGIGPCPGPGEYEVGQEVRRIAMAKQPDAERFFIPKGDRWSFDLRAANMAQLVRSGVEPAHISMASASTQSDARFYSVRRDGPDTGRFALFAGFREASP